VASIQKQLQDGGVGAPPPADDKAAAAKYVAFVNVSLAAACCQSRRWY
jgi:hypothetical protein